MAIEIANLSASLCSVDVTAVPNGLPKFVGPTGREFANVGFGAFAPTPAPSANSERLLPGVYRMHLLQTFTFVGGQVAALATPNVTDDQAAMMGFNGAFPPGINATGADLGTGTDVIVSMGGGAGGDDFLETSDGNFTLLVLQYPTQHTP